LQAASLKILVDEDVETFIKACFVRLGPVAAALDGHGGGIALVSHSHTTEGLDLVLDLTGACLSCGAAPGTLSGVKEDLEADEEISLIKFSVALLDTFDDLGREFILAHGNVDFV
jgi:Fe-S cluster biogenesis protein NfuA